MLTNHNSQTGASFLALQFVQSKVFIKQLYTNTNYVFITLF